MRSISIRECKLEIVNELNKLGKLSSSNPHNQAEYILCQILNIEKFRFPLILNQTLEEEQKTKYHEIVGRIKTGEPTAYIFNKTEFYNLSFKVDDSTLIPRPETELLVDIALEQIKRKNIQSIYDLGTGSGAIIISIAKELSGSKINFTGIDICPNAIKVARENAKLNNTIVNFKVADFTQNYNIENKSLIISNPPYISKTDLVEENVKKWEPKTALFSSQDGLFHIKCLIELLRKNPNSTLLFEFGFGQKDKISELIKSYLKDKNFHFFNDLAGIPRACLIE